MTDTGSQRQRPTGCKKHRKRVITYSMQHLGQRGMCVLSAWGAVVVWWQLVRVLTLTERLVENTLLPFFVWKGFRPASKTERCCQLPANEGHNATGVLLSCRNNPMA